MKTSTKLLTISGAALAFGVALSIPTPPSYADGAGTIEGSVVDASGKVVAGARITVVCGSVRKSATVDAAGHFTLTGLPEGTCTLTTSGSGFETSSLSIEVAGGSISTVLVPMRPPRPPRRPEPVIMPAAPMEAPAPAPREDRMAERAMTKPAKRLEPPRDPAKGAGATPVAKKPPAPPPLVMKDARLQLDEGRAGKNQDVAQRARGRRFERENNNWRAGGEAFAGPQGYAPVRVFPVPRYAKSYDAASGANAPRDDFRETIYWNPSVQTDAGGNASVEFYASDAVTAFRATAEGFSATGQPGVGQVAIQSKLPLTLDAHLPVEVTAGDTIQLPITLANETDEPIDARLVTSFGSAFKLVTSPRSELTSGKSIRIDAQSKQTFMFPLQVIATRGSGDVELALAGRGLEDKLKKTIRVVPKGFPFEVSASGTAKQGVTSKHEVDLQAALSGSITARVTMYPSPVASMTQGMEGMIREPGGCFEQTSATNYPNVMILSYLQSADAADPQLLDKTHGTLAKGYKLLTGYETPVKGFEWFGKSPGHEALTAYGLMQFADMSKVFSDVDRTMVERTATWLMSRRDGKGGFSRSATALDTFGRASEPTTNAYIMWALAEAKRTTGMDTELAVQRRLGTETKDPYLLALATNTNLLVGSPDAAAMAKRLAGMQGQDGGWTGAQESITRSGGESLVIETTALAMLALIKAGPAYAAQVRAGADFLNKRRGGYGQWGNTQATVLGLKALVAYSESARQMQAGGKATLLVNGKPVKTIAFDKGRKDALVWDDFSSALSAGKNTLEIQLESDDANTALPYAIAVDYRAARPQSSPAAKVDLTTQLIKTRSKMGEGVTLRAHVENKTGDGIPMTLARIGIPGGMVFQTWQLKELREKGLIDFYETRPREVILYWRALGPNAKKDVDLNLLASVPGTYEAPASSAYLYYTTEHKAWTAPVSIAIDR